MAIRWHKGWLIVTDAADLIGRILAELFCREPNPTGFQIALRPSGETFAIDLAVSYGHTQSVE